MHLIPLYIVYTLGNFRYTILYLVVSCSYPVVILWYPAVDLVFSTIGTYIEEHNKILKYS